MNENVLSVTDGVRKLFSVIDLPVPDFSIREKGEGEYADTLLYDGKEIPLFESRYDPYLSPIAAYGKEPEKNSALNVYSFADTSTPLDELMYRELEIAEYVLHAKITSVMAYVTPNAADMIIRMENGSAANINIGNTMAQGSMNQSQHRLITKKGMACDLASGDYTRPSPINVYGSDDLLPRQFDDDECFLYGMSNRDINKTATVYAILTGRLDASSWPAIHRRLIKAITAVHKSAASGLPVVLDA